jgi:hypothetical protein
MKPGIDRFIASVCIASTARDFSIALSATSTAPAKAPHLEFT